MPDYEGFRLKLAATPPDKIVENLAHGRYAVWKRPLAEAHLAKLAAAGADAAKQQEDDKARIEARRLENEAKRQQQFDNRLKVAGLALTALGIVVAAVLGYLRS